MRNYSSKNIYHLFKKRKLCNYSATAQTICSEEIIPITKVAAVASSNRSKGATPRGRKEEIKVATK